MKIQLKRAAWLLSAALLTFTPSAVFAQTSPASAKADKEAKKAIADTKAKTAAPAAAAASAQDIEAAKAKGMVWVNTTTKVYHKDGQFYGTTKHGKFMTEADAAKAGYKAAKEGAVKAKK